MVSLCKLSRVDEEGVSFQSPYSLKPMAETDNQDSKVKDNRSSLSEDVDSEKKDEMLMTPEKSIEIQTKLGADIMMQLDDVVHVLTKGGFVVSNHDPFQMAREFISIKSS